MKTPTSNSCDGAIAQLGERIVRNDEVVGSIPTSSTKSFAKCATDLQQLYKIKASKGFFSCVLVRTLGGISLC
jgi:hypothetical protein